jgi:LysR family pca operon transcriptional activator
MYADRLKLRHLRTLVAIAERGSLVGAADALSVTQPAITKSLAELEAIIGQPLVERTRKGVQFTPMGHVLLRYAGSSLRTLREGLESIARAQRADSPTIVVGALPNVGATVLPRAVRQFAGDFPLARLRIRSGSNGLLLAAMRQGDLDLVIGRMGHPGDMQGLTFEQLYTEPLVFVVRPGHPLAQAPSLSVADLRGVSLLLPDAGTRIRAIADAFFLSSGLSLADPMLETIDASFGRAYVQASDAVWCVPLGVAQGDLRSGALVRLALDTGETSGPVGVTQRADRIPSEIMQSLTEGLRASAEIYRKSIGDA